MSDSDSNAVDIKRRRILIGATSVVGAVGTVAFASPLVISWKPSARALNAGAPVEMNFSKLQPGMKMQAVWQGKPIWVVNRTEKMLADLPGIDSSLADPGSEVVTQQPDYAKNAVRSRKPEIMVLIGICTHLGCSPTFRPELAPADLGADWKGGFFCPCHGSKFDLAGRVFKSVPAPTNLEVPKHYFKTDNIILIGKNGGAV